jgi:CheY-like chemotaxis protein
MARIIHVEDGTEWADAVRRALVDHQVDIADTFEAAVDLIRNEPPYDVALVDLNLLGEADGMGGEILELLKDRFPTTRRVVITASPPSANLRASLFDRYELDDVLIKGKLTIPGVRVVVAHALSRAGATGGVVPQFVKAQQSELSERYFDWHDRLSHSINARIRETQRALSGATDPAALATGDRSLQDWQGVREIFTMRCTEVETAIFSITSAEEVNSAANVLDKSQTYLTELVSRFTTSKVEP